MPINHIVFADVSSLSVAGKNIEGCTAFQASRAADQRPIYTWGKSKPQAIIGTPGIGSGSFSYVASDGTTGAANQDWSATGYLDGAAAIVVTGGEFPTTGGGTQTLTFTSCSFAGQSAGMNAKNEMVVTINFTFPNGTF